MRSEPSRRILIDYAPEVSDTSYLKHDDAVVIIEDTEAQKRIDYLAGLERCLNDPNGLKGPAIINRSFEGLVKR